MGESVKPTNHSAIFLSKKTEPTKSANAFDSRVYMGQALRHLAKLRVKNGQLKGGATAEARWPATLLLAALPCYPTRPHLNKVSPLSLRRSMQLTHR